jgi:hypothetical protein
MVDMHPLCKFHRHAAILCRHPVPQRTQDVRRPSSPVAGRMPCRMQQDGRAMLVKLYEYRTGVKEVNRLMWPFVCRMFWRWQKWANGGRHNELGIKWHELCICAPTGLSVQQYLTVRENRLRPSRCRVHVWALKLLAVSLIIQCWCTR